MKRTLNFEIRSENGVFIAHCIELGIETDGDTAAEAETNLREALDIYYSDPGNLIED